MYNGYHSFITNHSVFNRNVWIFHLNCKRPCLNVTLLSFFGGWKDMYFVGLAHKGQRTKLLSKLEFNVLIHQFNAEEFYSGEAT